MLALAQDVRGWLFHWVAGAEPAGPEPAGATEMERFDERIRRSTLRHGETLAALFVLGTLALWPFDVVLFDETAGRTASAIWRTASIALNVTGVVVARRLRRSLRHVFPVIGSFAVANAAGLGVLLGGLGGADASWLAASYAVPLAVLPLVMPLPHRVVTTAAVSTACVGAYLAVRPTALTSPANLTSIITLASITGMSIALGHLYFLLFRDNYEQRARLAERVAERTERLRQLLAHVDSVQRDERRRIGRELHDELAQALTALRLEVSLALRTSDSDTRCSAALTRIDRVVDQLLEAKNRLVVALRPAVLERVGLAEAIGAHAREVAVRAELEIDLDIQPAELSVDDPVASTAFRVVQEALTNVVRHAAASTVRIRIRQSATELTLAIADDGAGFDPLAIDGTRFGLLGLRERTTALGGSVRIESAPGCGTVVSVILPRPRLRRATTTGPIRRMSSLADEHL